MFSAVSNLGAGGTQDTALVDTANGVLYGMFALTGLVSGGINNREFSLSSEATLGHPHDALSPRPSQHSSRSPPYPLHRIPWLLALYWVLVVVSF